MRGQGTVIAAALLLAGCGGGGTSTPRPTPAPTATPTPTPTPAPAPSFFEGVTHFDAFDRADTAPGTLTLGPQGQAYEIFGLIGGPPDTITQIRSKRLYTPPVSDNTVRASYVLTEASAPVKRLGAVIEYSDNTEAPKGGFGYVWTIILSTRKNRFYDEMIHFTGADRSWNLEIWKTDGSRRALAGGNFGTALSYGQLGIVDLKLDGNTVTVTVPGATQQVADADLALFADARFPIVEHYIPGNTQNIQQYRAWYYTVQGALPVDPELYRSFEPN